MRATQILVLLLVASACTPDEPPDAGQPVPTPTAAPAITGDGSYDFERPAVSFALPPELREVSGLTVLPDGRLGAVQDEDGLLFALNPATGAIEARYPFGDGGDYEGVERVGDAVYVLRSNGTLIELAAWDASPQTRSHETPLKGKNDTEGLAYDAAAGRLLIACKEDPGAGLGNDEKAIYAYDLASGSLSPEPAYAIDLDEVDERLPGKGTFKPSAVALHPTSGALYVLSSTRKGIVVLGRDGDLRHTWRLSDSMFAQPEGLAFGPDGALFIASEGGDGPAMLYRFDPGNEP